MNIDEPDNRGDTCDVCGCIPQKQQERYTEFQCGSSQSRDGSWHRRVACSVIARLKEERAVLDIDTQCKIAFAEMELAWMKQPVEFAVQSTVDSYRRCRAAMLSESYDKQGVLAELHRVTRELRGEK